MMRRVMPTFLRPVIASVALRWSATPSLASATPSLASAAFDYDPIPSSKVEPDPTVLHPRVVVYDGTCHLCHRGVKWVIKVDKDALIKFCCLQSKAAEPYLLLCGVDREYARKRMLFIEGPEGCYEGSTGVSLSIILRFAYPRMISFRQSSCWSISLSALKVASYLPFPFSALSALLIIPGPIRDAAYDYVAERRYDWLGKAGECIVMKEKDLLERFIDRDEILSNRDDIY